MSSEHVYEKSSNGCEMPNGSQDVSKPNVNKTNKTTKVKKIYCIQNYVFVSKQLFLTFFFLQIGNKYICIYIFRAETIDF